MIDEVVGERITLNVNIVNGQPITMTRERELEQEKRLKESRRTKGTERPSK
jgi:hypothetical protein